MRKPRYSSCGSEVYGAVTAGRKGVGIELKESYYNQAVRNVYEAVNGERSEQGDLLASVS